MTEIREDEKTAAKGIRIPRLPFSVIMGLGFATVSFVLHFAPIDASISLFQLIADTLKMIRSGDVTADIVIDFSLLIIFVNIIACVVIPLFLFAMIYAQKDWARWVFAVYAFLLGSLFVILSFEADSVSELLQGCLLAVSIMTFFLPESNRWFKARAV
jgi:hypothetical protein